jgi:hypothetical protein
MHLKVLFMPNSEQPKQNPQFWDKRLSIIFYVLLLGSIGTRQTLQP